MILENPNLQSSQKRRALTHPTFRPWLFSLSVSSAPCDKMSQLALCIRDSFINQTHRYCFSLPVYLSTCMYYLYTWLIYQSNTWVLLQFTCIPACISARVIDMSHRRRRRVVYTRHEVYTAVPDTSLFCCRSHTDTPRNTHSRSCTPSST